ncbi:hypothetical protein ACTZWW_05040 [Salinarimonas sp. NSM]|uniref:hypothetical protein n=1 Tax=Salinarimonas sp. NSM TaxID=3458003 RepID=UPI004036AC9A
MFDQHTLETLRGCVDTAVEETVGRSPQPLGKHRQLTISIQALLRALQDHLGAGPTAEQALAAAAALGITSSMGTIHRHMTLDRQRRAPAGDGQTMSAAAASAGCGALPTSIEMLLSEARTTLERITVAVHEALEVERRARDRFHREEVDRIRADYEGRIALLDAERKEAQDLAEVCIADADETAAVAADLQRRNYVLSEELAETTAERDHLSEAVAELERTIDAERAASQEARGIAAAKEQKARDMHERVHDLSQQIGALAGELEAARKARAVAEERSEQLQAMLAADRERLARLDALMEATMGLALQISHRAAEQGAAPSA